MADIKEKLLDLLFKTDRECSNKACITCRYQDKRFVCKIHFFADHLIANGVTFATDNNVGGKWISVEERLPTEDDGDAVGAVLAIHKAAKKKYWHWGNVAENPYDFTCWMPLPEPPKGG